MTFLLNLWQILFKAPQIIGIIKAIIDVIVGGFLTQQVNKQAALGGAAIPFLSGSPSPSPSTLPPGDSTAESTVSSLTSSSEPPSPPSPQADSGQTISTKLSKPLIRRMR